MVRRCEMLVTTPDGGQTVAGTFLFDGDRLAVMPSKGYERLMANVYREPVMLAGGELVRREDDPARWFESLPLQYNGSRLNARIMEGAPGTSPVQAARDAIGTDLDLESAIAALCATKAIIEEPKAYDEPEEDRIRDLIAQIAYYDESGPGFDPTGKYLCGTCNMRLLPAKCSHVSGRISMDAGSCEIYQIGEPAWPDQPVKFTQKEAGYGTREQAKGFGCSRCERGHPAREPDGAGRTIWCRRWGTRVQSLACCMEESGPDLMEAPGE